MATEYLDFCKVLLFWRIFFLKDSVLGVLLHGRFEDEGECHCLFIAWNSFGSLCGNILEDGKGNKNYQETLDKIVQYFHFI